MGVRTDRHVFASPLGNMTNGTDALANLERILQKAGTDLSNVVTCLFFLPNNTKVFDLFGGFYEAFNVKNPPPPSRGELQSVLEEPTLEVAAKCVAALPSPSVATTRP